jgi:spore germination protein KC
MHKKIAFWVLCCLLTPMLSSCYDARETDEMAYVMTIGVDRGVSNKLRYSFQIPLMKGGSGGDSQSAGSGKESEFEVFAVDAPTFFAAVNLLNSTISRKLNFVHTKYMVFSEEAAKSGFLEITIGALFRFKEMRKSVDMIVVKGESYDFLNHIKPVLGSMLSKYQETLMEQTDETGFFPSTRAYDVYNNMKSYYMDPIAILGGINNFNHFIKKGEKWEGAPEPTPYSAGEVPRIGGNKIEFMGSVLFNGPKMVGELNGFDTRILLLIRDEVQRMVFVSEDPLSPGEVLTIDMKQRKKPDVKVILKDGKPVINLKIELEGDYLTIQSGIDYEKDKNRKLLEKFIEEQVDEQVAALIEKCKSLECDVFGFGYAASWNFGSIQEFEKYNWKAHFKDSEVNTEVNFIVKRPGTMIKSSPIITKEGGSK